MKDRRRVVGAFGSYCSGLMHVVVVVIVAGIIGSVTAFPPNSNSILSLQQSSSIASGTIALHERSHVVTASVMNTRSASSFEKQQKDRGMLQRISHRNKDSIVKMIDLSQRNSYLTTLRAGAAASEGVVAGSSEKKKCPFTAFVGLMSSLWGSGGVIYILAKAIIRVLPIALEPFQTVAETASANAVPLTQFQLAAYILTCLFFAYAEGYKGFQLKFSPLVVARSFSVTLHSPFHHHLFAPLYSMGLFHATRKRMIVSWSVTLGVATIVALVKRLPYPWRNIVDAGVVVGLTWGSLCIAIEYFKALLTGNLPEVDPALPPAKSSK